MRFKIFDSFLEKYNFNENHQTLFDIIEELQEKVKVLEEKYEGALIDIKRLEEENIETTNCLYENANSIDAVDRRIDILAEHCGIAEDV
jgi:hypothetical protein